MARPSRLLLLLSLLWVAACEQDAAPREVVSSAPEAAPVASQRHASMPDGLVALAEFTMEVNPDEGTVELVDLRMPQGSGASDNLRSVRQADWCEVRVTEGRPRTVSLQTDPGSISFTMAGCGVSGFPFDTLGVFCFDATVTNHFDQPLRLLAQITSVVPDVGHNPYVYLAGTQEEFGASASDVAPSQVSDSYNAAGIGLFDHGEVASSGASTVRWGFEYQPEPFRFEGRMLARIPDVCDGIDNDCDGLVDEGTNNVDNCAACGLRTDLGVYGGEVMYGHDAVDGGGTSLRGEVDWDATVSAAGLANVDTFAVEVGYAGGVADISAVEALSAALNASGTTGRIIPLFDGPKRRGQTLSAWMPDFQAVVAALSAHDSPYVDSFVINQLHRDLCTPISSGPCWGPSDVALLTSTLASAMGGRGMLHLLYVPADYRALTYFDDALWISTNFSTRRAGERLAVSMDVELDLSPQRRVSSAMLSYAWAPRSDPNHKFVVEIDVDGATTTLLDSGPFVSFGGLSAVGGVGRVNDEDRVNLRPLLSSKTAATDVTLRFAMDTLANGFSSTNVVLGDLELVFEITDTSTDPPSVQTITRTLAQLTDVTATYSFAGTTPIVDSTGPFNLTPYADGTMIQLVGSDALTDRVFADYPAAADETMGWADRALPDHFRNYALLPAVDSFAVNGWYHWEDGLFEEVAGRLNDTLLEGIVLLDAPLALAAPDDGVFDQDSRMLSEGYFVASEIPNATPINGWYHALETESLPEAITRLFVWDSSTTGDRLRTRVVVDAGGGDVVLYDGQTSADEGSWSSGSCVSPYVAPQLEVPALPAVGQVCMVDVDLGPIGGSIPAGAFVRFESTLVQEPEGPAAGILNVEVATAGDEVVFLPACAADRCDLEDPSWTFSSGVQVPDVPSNVAQYPWDIVNAMMADFAYDAPAPSCNTY